MHIFFFIFSDLTFFWYFPENIKQVIDLTTCAKHIDHMGLKVLKFPFLIPNNKDIIS